MNEYTSDWSQFDWGYDLIPSSKEDIPKILKLLKIKALPKNIDYN